MQSLWRNRIHQCIMSRLQKRGALGGLGVIVVYIGDYLGPPRNAVAVDKQSNLFISMKGPILTFTFHCHCYWVGFTQVIILPSYIAFTNVYNKTMIRITIKPTNVIRDVTPWLTIWFQVGWCTIFSRVVCNNFDTLI